MKCKNVKKKLWRYHEGELADRDRLQIQQHLDKCPDCARLSESFASFLTPPEKIAPVTPPPRLWEKIYLKIEDYENSLNPLSHFIEQLPHLVTIGLFVVIFFVSVFIGIYLGSYPDNLSKNQLRENVSISIYEEFSRDTYIDSFDDLPPFSIGSVYLTLQYE